MNRKQLKETIINYHQNQIPNSPVKSVHENFIAQVDTELKSIEYPIEPQKVAFEFDHNKVLSELNKLANLTKKVRIRIDYSSKKQPLVSVCVAGNGKEQLTIQMV